MNWRGMRAVVRRDLTVVLGSKAIVLPALLVPAILLVLLPAAAGLAPQLMAGQAGDVGDLVGMLPEGAVDQLSPDRALAAAEVLIIWVFSPMILMVPVMYSAVIAADAIAGEKERGTLEGLLLTPLSDRELVAAKLMTAWLPASVLGVAGAVVYAVVGNLSVGLQSGRLLLPTAEFAVMALWVGPTFAAAALGAVLLVSVRAKSTQEAFQVGGVVIVPVVVLIVTQATGALLLSVWLLVVAGVLAAAAAAALVWIGARLLSRAKLGERL